ncbi:hypothetical protein GCM10027418_00810 [Mariniluteicoccus endophyticus]
MKKVATAPRELSASSTLGVSLPGPSSKVNATHFTARQSTAAPGAGWGAFAFGAPDSFEGLAGAFAGVDGAFFAGVDGPRDGVGASVGLGAGGVVGAGAEVTAGGGAGTAGAAT